MFLICYVSSQGVMGIYGWELFAAYHRPGKFGDHRSCKSGDIMVLICHVTACLKS